MENGPEQNMNDERFFNWLIFLFSWFIFLLGFLLAGFYSMLYLGQVLFVYDGKTAIELINPYNFAMIFSGVYLVVASFAIRMLKKESYINTLCLLVFVFCALTILALTVRWLIAVSLILMAADIFAFIYLIKNKKLFN